MIRQCAKVVCNGEYRVMVNTDAFGDASKKPYAIYRCSYGHKKQIRKCNSLHEALGALANILIQF